MITAQDIREKTFEKSRMNGYDMASVDDFLEELAEDIGAAQKENAVLKSKMKVLVDKIEEYLIRADYERLEESSRKFALELLVENRLFTFAHEKIQEYGIDQISSNARLVLFEYLMEKLQFQEDEFTLNLAFSA